MCLEKKILKFFWNFLLNYKKVEARGRELITENNLVYGHAFTITNFATVNHQGEEKKLVR